MKKFLSMVMAAAMVVSLVPATAFAASGDIKATAKVVDAANLPADGMNGSLIGGGAAGNGKNPELQLTMTTADYAQGGVDVEFTVTLDNATFDKTQATGAPTIYIKGDVNNATTSDNAWDADTDSGDTCGSYKIARVYEDKDEMTVRVQGEFDRGDILSIRLGSLSMDKVSKGKTATISVDSSDMTVTNGDDLVFAAVEASNIKASVKDTVDVAVEEVATLKDVKVETTVGDFDDFLDGVAKEELKLKLNSGFEFALTSDAKIVGPTGVSVPLTGAMIDDDELVVKGNVLNTILATDTWTIKGLKVDAVSAKAGSTATMRVYLTGADTVSLEVAKAIDFSVVMSVDEDEDVPVIYSGVDVDNTGIVDDSDHESLEVTIKESFAGAWSNSKDFTLEVPEGVYITNVDSAHDGDFALSSKVTNIVGGGSTIDTDDWFAMAYQEGDHLNLEFERRTWEETNPDDKDKDDAAEITFTLTLVADPNFEGDVALTLKGDALDEQSVTIAKFVKPFVVETQQNDMQIDYRNTEIPTSVVIKEAEAGLWDKGTEFKLALDKIEFDDEGKIAVDSKSGLEIKDNEIKEKGGVLSFTVDSRSDDEPAVVTISGIQLYMQRSLPAGAYDLDVWSPTMLADKFDVDGDPDSTATKGYLVEDLFAPVTDEAEAIVADVNDDFVSYTAKAGFVNIVTAGREDTDSFTTKVVVPVGESYLISGETKQEIPVPAYINADGYTMLPLRAVAKALGINENNVLWDQASRTATVMYGSKIISMTYGQKVVYVNAAPIPASTSVEIKENRMFLGLRDLGNALGVTDITWDGATKTATLNGSK